MAAYLEDADPETFDWRAYAKSRLPANYGALSSDLKRQARIQATRKDPLLFAILYFSKTLSGGGEGDITFADLHFDLCRVARHFAKPLDPVSPLRLAFIAPRRAGKTSWLYKIIAFWVAAHQHRKFFYVLTGTGGQAMKWITNFKVVIDQNATLKNDFPELCSPMKREATGRAYADSANLYVSASGFAIGAQAADSNSLGLSFDDERPDLILFDDIEPPGGSYSVHEMNKRLTNVLEGAIPMGAEGATVIFVGTVLMPGSIMDQLRIYSVNPDPKSWISEEGIRVKHYKPFVDRETKEQTISAGPNSRSFWPGRHKTEMLIRDQGTRSFAVKYANEPLPESGAFWRPGDIQYGTLPPTVATITAIVLDPAVTTKKKSDFSALAVIRYAPSLGQFEVLFGRAFKLNPGTEMPQKVAEVFGYFPEATLLMVEVNQGGDLWRDHYGSVPGLHYLPIRQNASDGNKAQRAAPVLRLYQTGRVFHTDASLLELERELYSFPSGLHDDLPDAVCFGVLKLQQMYGDARAQDREASYV